MLQCYHERRERIPTRGSNEWQEASPAGRRGIHVLNAYLNREGNPKVILSGKPGSLLHFDAATGELERVEQCHTKQNHPRAVPRGLLPASSFSLQLDPNLQYEVSKGGREGAR